MVTGKRGRGRVRARCAVALARAALSGGAEQQRVAFLMSKVFRGDPDRSVPPPPSAPASMSLASRSGCGSPIAPDARSV
eukprot:229768-Rhodomonas_salina.1